MYVSIVVEYTTVYILPRFIPSIHYTQQDHVLQELAGHCVATPDVPEILSDLETLNFLRALNKMFERGILSSGRFNQSAQKKYYCYERVSPILKAGMRNWPRMELTLTAAPSLNFLHGR